MPYPPRPSAYPLRYLAPRLRTAYRRSQLGSCQIALCAGFPHQSSFSVVINAEVVRATPLLVERLQRVADILGVSHDQIFLSDPAEQEVA